MRFAATHKVVSYLMVTTAFLVLALSGELPLALTLLTTIGIGVSFFFDPQRHPFMHRPVYTHAWTAVLVLAMAYAGNQYLHGEPLLGAGTTFLCWLLLAKMWNRKANRDYLQAYVVSFFMLVSGTVLNNNVVYAVCFVFYVVFSTWTLTLFHLRREMEENYLLKHVPGKDGKAAESERVEVDRILNSRRVVGPRFLLGTSVISAGIFLTSGIIFFLTPRIGLSLDIPLQRHGLTTSGFSDRIELGGHGRIRDNPAIVMRVESKSGKPEHPLHFRGVTFDRYDRGRWSRSRDISPPSFVRFLNYYFVDTLDERPSYRQAEEILDSALRLEVYLEPLDVGVLFAPSRVVAVAPPEAALPGTFVSLYPGPGGEIFVRDRKAGLRYSTFSDVVPRSAEVLQKSPPLLGPKDPGYDAELYDGLRPYLVVPQNLPPRIRQLARQITAKHQAPHDKAMAILQYLQRYSYTTQLERDERYEPLEDFLFIQRKGHCEYFASAMAILLRESGVPSRSVNGYLGGEWNEYGRYLVVRQQDAHSWVEAYLVGVGWVTYDPTPPSALLLQGAGFLSGARQLLDTLELSWFKYVIEYDLRAQIQMAQSVRGFLRGDKKGHGGFHLKALRMYKVPAAIVLGVLVLLGLSSLGYLRLRRRLRPRTDRQRVKADGLIRQAVHFIARRGHTQRPGETLQQLAARVLLDEDPAGVPFADLVRRYYAVRFGNEVVVVDVFRRLVRAVLHSPPLQRPARPKVPPAAPAAPVS